MHEWWLRIAIGLVSLAVILLLYGYIYPMIRVSRDKKPLWDGYRTIEYELEGKKRTLVVAETRGEWQKGLMHVTKPFAYDGMIFTSQHALPQMFWNMNTLVDLDVYWIRDETVLGKSFLPAVTTAGIVTVSSPSPANTVIEIIR